MTRRRRAGGALVGALLLGVAGCAAPVELPDPRPPACAVAADAAVVLAVSRRANSSADLPQEIGVLVERVVRGVPAGVHGPTISVISIDGAPTVIESDAFFSTAPNGVLLRDHQDAFIAGVGESLTGMRAAEPEADVHAALVLAGVAAGAPGPGTVVLVDSGVATRGWVDFTQPGLLDAQPADVVEYLRVNDVLPDLTGLTVLLALGEVVLPQESLGPRAARVREIWTAVALAGGATCVASIPGPLRQVRVDGAPPVTEVAVESPPPPGCAGGVLRDTGAVAFVMGTEDFVDDDAAREQLRPLAAELGRPSCGQVLLVGTTARWGTEAYQRNLGRLRAEKVRSVLVDELGADPARIQTDGVGSWFQGYVPDNGPGGELLPGPAQLNRTVRVIPCTPQCPTP